MSLSASSFRDPSGKCWVLEHRVIRALGSTATSECEAFLQTSAARDFLARKQLVSTRRLSESEAVALREAPEWRPWFGDGETEAYFEHERVPFRSYPYEWPPEMLWEAGRLTLELAKGALEAGYGMKDATPYNVLFRGSEGVFVDVASFEARREGDPVWTPYAQFIRTFLLPLLASRYWGMRLADIFTTHRDGLEPQEVYRWCGLLRKLRPQFLSLVSIPTWLRPRARASGQALYETRTLADPEKAKFIVDALLNQLQRKLNGLKPGPRPSSVWSGYMGSNSYNEASFAAKERFVDEVLAQFQPKRLLDVGANTGHFSARAARAGARVVALDYDPVCVGAIWEEARAHKLDILPLVIDLARPSPPMGWRNCELPSFLERASGQFDCVLMLAVIHHLLVTERVPLESILELASELTTSLLIVEFVAPEDEMFRQLTRGRDHLHAGLNEAVFERACAAHFETVKTLPLPGTHRRLYALKRKGGGT